MDDDLIKKVQDTSIKAIKEFKAERQMAHAIKYELDKLEGYGWNCIVGRNFGTHIVH